MGVFKVAVDTFHNFGDQTSIAGLNYVVHRKSIVKKVYWLALFLIGAAFTILNLETYLVAYYERDVITSTDLTNVQSVQFPAVTICNLNRVSCFNLFEEYVVFQKTLENMTKNGTDSESIKGVNKTYQSIDTLVSYTGCKNELCKALLDKLPVDFNDLIDPPKEIFNILMGQAAALECSSLKVCYMMFRFHENRTETYTEYDMQDVTNGLHKLKCNDKSVMHMLCTEGVGFWKLYSHERPFFCESKGQNLNFGGSYDQESRKKRQTGPNGQIGPGPGPGEIPEGPSPSKSEDFRNEAIFLRKFMELDEAVRGRIGHRLGWVFSSLQQINNTGFIAKCTYKGVSCKSNPFWYAFQTAEYGNCYSFNSNYNMEDKEKKRTATLTGSMHGLSVEVFLDQSNYMHNKLTKKAGARVILHDPKNPPLADEYGIDIEPNTASSMSIQRTEITRMSHPYKPNCTSFWNETGYDVKTDTKYSLASCLRYCLQKNVAETCDCFHPNLIQIKMNSTFGRKPCLIEGSEKNTDFLCFNGILNQYSNLSRKCPCNVACRVVQYSATASTSKWPSNQYTNDMAKEYFGIDVMDQKTKTEFQGDYAKVDVYFQTLDVKSITQSAKYPDDTLISNIGGALSLFLGIALIMAFELVELIWDLVSNIFTYYTKK